ncbi:SDR family NAD(P)-dependent oxidoreductase [Pseudoalteromonas aurantia]|uniref:3-oxoacyl-ACP reductase n=1 Tax=Pseudoalteromonas aurantia TaxID=43654 RepID=A0A5S3UXR3_9GAMM|nr:SDR family NAD(P)-dependent oxidoreductase [Pseudoalteromonas aurantia]TMO62483.1 3-oxoacyl-ACP reductase [Pseudoalteromonas aurantia]TMO62510.1 3-oxoacyl-ACP reductase [Pseudoalteromonas aurantia]TMO76414.1 3-oxoacyl-ACP reductase [Pseudoalteromonas aurantia]
MNGFSSSLLANKTVLVTGAGKGIGRACALMAAKCGAQVIAVARTQADLIALQNEHPSHIQVWQEDITSPHFLDRVLSLNELHGLVNNVGTNKVANMFDQADEDLDIVLDLNLKSLYRTAKAALTPIKKAGGGAIVNMSSQMAYVGSPGRTLYCMSKHGVEGLTKAMGVELAPLGIRVNSVCPTFVLTPMTKPMLENEEFKEFVYNMIPMKKLATTEDVANACLFLLSELASMVTATSIKVDGGWTAQ